MLKAVHRAARAGRSSWSSRSVSLCAGLNLEVFSIDGSAEPRECGQKGRPDSLKANKESDE